MKEEEGEQCDWRERLHCSALIEASLVATPPTLATFLQLIQPQRGHCQADISTISGISTITTPAATTTEQVQIIVVVIIMIIIFFFFGALTVPTTIICLC